MEVARDDVFCLEIARRSVARAALHLGIENMTEECLNVLGDVLLSYLQRLGKTLAYSVESSGRSSAHTNVLDALNSIELCTSPAILRMHISHQQEEENEEENSENQQLQPQQSSQITNNNPNMSDTPTNGSRIPNGANNNTNGSCTASNNAGKNDASSFICHDSHTRWQGLAAFCFGMNWDQKNISNPLIEEGRSQQGGQQNSSSLGGKQGPSSLLNGNSGDGTGTHINGVQLFSTSNKKGWIAPYPDEIQPFPISSWDNTNGNDAKDVSSSITTSCTVANNNNPNARHSDTKTFVKTKTANPHSLPSQIAWSLHGIIKHENETNTNTSMNCDDKEEIKSLDQRLQLLPDAAFITTDASNERPWGGIYKDHTTYAINHYADLENKRNNHDTNNNNNSGSSKRKVDSMLSNDDGKGGNDSSSLLNKDEQDKKNSNTATKVSNAKDNAAIGDKNDGSKSTGADTSPPKKKVKIDDKKGIKSSSLIANNNSKSNSNTSSSNAAVAAVILFRQQQNSNEELEQKRKVELQANYEKYKHYPQYVPVFYPSLPTRGGKGSGAGSSMASGGKTVLDIIKNELDNEERELKFKNANNSNIAKQEQQHQSSSDIKSASFGLRSALVDLGQSYWGSGWDAAPASKTTKKGSTAGGRLSSKGISGEKLTVPLGRPTSAAATTKQGGRTGSNGKNNANKDLIIPLGRASGSRVSRILEGSMDAAAMN